MFSPCFRAKNSRAAARLSELRKHSDGTPAERRKKPREGSALPKCSPEKSAELPIRSPRPPRKMIRADRFPAPDLDQNDTEKADHRPKSSKAGPVLREDGRRGSRRRNAEKLTEGAAPEAELFSSPRGPLFLHPERVLLSCRALLYSRAFRGAVRRSEPSPARAGGSQCSDPELPGSGIQTGGRFFRRPFSPAVLASPENA